MLIRTSLIGLMVLAGAFAQPPGRGPGHFGLGPEPGGPGGARFLGAEAGMPGRVVKNAPYTADVVTEITQTLSDGSHIRQSNTVHVSRDTEGRTRREQALNTLNGLAPNSNLPHVVFINDPVAGVNYALNPSNRTASKSAWNRTGPGGPGRTNARPPQPPPAGGSTDVARGPGRAGRRGANQNVKTETLGRQTVEGVQADGTRTTMTIPAGQIGNEMPLQIVRESWYSQELKAVVMTKSSDPRTGEVVTHMSNLSRAEPPSSQFQVPVDYKVSETSGHRGPGPAQQ